MDKEKDSTKEAKSKHKTRHRKVKSEKRSSSSSSRPKKARHKKAKPDPTQDETSAEQTLQSKREHRRLKLKHTLQDECSSTLQEDLTSIRTEEEQEASLERRRCSHCASHEASTESDSTAPTEEILQQEEVAEKSKSKSCAVAPPQPAAHCAHHHPPSAAVVVKRTEPRCNIVGEGSWQALSCDGASASTPFAMDRRGAEESCFAASAKSKSCQPKCKPKKCVDRERIIAESCVNARKVCDGETEVLYNTFGARPEFVFLQVQNTGECPVALGFTTYGEEDECQQRQRTSSTRSSTSVLNRHQARPRLAAVVRPGRVVILTLTDVKKILWKCCNCKKQRAVKHRHQHKQQKQQDACMPSFLPTTMVPMNTCTPATTTTAPPQRTCQFSATIKAGFCHKRCSSPTFESETCHESIF